MLTLFAEPITTILGMPEVYIDSSSTVNLTCIVNGLNEPPTSIIWTHNGYVSNKLLLEIDRKLDETNEGVWLTGKVGFML